MRSLTFMKTAKSLSIEKRHRLIENFYEELSKRIVFDGSVVELSPIEQTKAYRSLIEAGIQLSEA